MSDYGSRYTDKKISEVDKSLRSVYGRAQKELEGKLKEFTRKSEAKDKVMRRDMQKGLISEQDYKNWLAGQVFVRQQWERKISQVCMIMNDHNQQAINLINESRLDVFAENYNYMTFQTEKRIAISFDLYNVQAVARLLLDDPQLLPEWKIDEEKDYIWNYQKVKNIVTQAIIQGEGIPEITRHLCEDLSSQNNSRMRSLAITAMTGAENAGRQLQMESAAKLGIDVWKRWEATHDSRTRDLHRARDGEEVPYNEDFSGGMEYPGDPSGAPEDVYGCRCTMVSFYPEYENKEQAAQRYKEMEIDGQSYEEWKAGKQKNGEVLKFDNPYEGFREGSNAYAWHLTEMYGEKKGEEIHDKISKAMFAEWKKTGKSVEWADLVSGKAKNSEVEDILRAARASANSETIPAEKKETKSKGLTAEEKKQGLDLYKVFIEGGSTNIHRLAGYKDFGGGYDPKLVDEEKMRLLDSVFTPAKEEMHLYKGNPMTQGEIDAILTNGGFFNHTLSSTSTSDKTAHWYMDNASEDFGTLPVYMDIRVEPGVPIADAQALLGNDGMKAFEKEITIGRNVEWALEGTRTIFDSAGDQDEYLEMKIVIRKKEE